MSIFKNVTFIWTEKSHWGTSSIFESFSNFLLKIWIIPQKTEEPSQPKKSGSIFRVFRILFCCCFDPRYWKQKIEKWMKRKAIKKMNTFVPIFGLYCQSLNVSDTKLRLKVFFSFLLYVHNELRPPHLKAFCKQERKSAVNSCLLLLLQVFRHFLAQWGLSALTRFALCTHSHCRSHLGKHLLRHFTQRVMKYIKIQKVFTKCILHTVTKCHFSFQYYKGYNFEFSR